jgi:hypothetical protein
VTSFPKRARRDDPNGHMVVQEMLEYLRDRFDTSVGAGSGSGIAGALGQPYANTTPVLSASGGGAPTIGNASNIISKRSIWGKTCHYYGRFTLGSTTSFGSGELYLTLDVPSLSNGVPSVIGTGWTYDVSTAQLMHTHAQIVAVNQVRFLSTATYYGTSVAVSGTIPFPMTWATGDEFAWHLLYETA